MTDGSSGPNRGAEERPSAGRDANRQPESEVPAGRAERAESLLDDLFRDGRTNALVAWGMLAVLGAVLVESVVDLDVEWILLVATTGALAVLPAVAYRDWRVMVPWEVLALALLPILVRGLVGGEVGTFATYLALAAAALVVVVELHAFTSLEVTHWFAVVLVAFATMAAGAVNAVVRWLLDRYLETAYLSSLDALMEHMLWITAAGVVGGLTFDLYFRWRDRRLRADIAREVPDWAPADGDGERAQSRDGERSRSRSEERRPAGDDDHSAVGGGDRS